MASTTTPTLRPTRQHRPPVALVVAAGALVALGPALPSAASTRRPPVHRSVRAPVTVALARRGKLGTVLVDARGFTLYHYLRDARDTSRCTGACASLWPPLLLPKGETRPVGRGVRGLGTIRRDGRLQVTYNGIPLYRYAGDTKPGQARGQGYAHLWTVVHPGNAATAAPRPKRPRSTTTTSSAYGY
ncbi:MAG TPA: hypothetical protein VKV23_06485 [Acidimicrobiales bacterium]|nr:hypothetical protein [Acidimicrobiales bacterium]